MVRSIKIEKMMILKSGLKKKFCEALKKKISDLGFENTENLMIFLLLVSYGKAQKKEKFCLRPTEKNKNLGWKKFKKEI